MKRPNPASVILFGLAIFVVASSRQGPILLLGAAVLVFLAMILSAAHARLLAHRSRWLLLAMLVMFGWFTPGTPLPFLPGASQEGLSLAADNLARLLIALSLVALMLRALAAPELVAGMRTLLAPLALVHVSRDRIAVRLALTLSEVESSRQGIRGETTRQESTLALPAADFGASDMLMNAVTGAMFLGAWLS